MVLLCVVVLYPAVYVAILAVQAPPDFSPGAKSERTLHFDLQVLRDAKWSPKASE